jgi:protein phosphatase
MDTGFASLRGTVREKDEDSILLLSEITTKEGKEEARVIAAVADGMGGGDFGEVASEIAVTAIRNECGSFILRDRFDLREVQNALKRSFEKANSEILKYSEDRGLYMMGTTLTAVFLAGNNLVVGNIGDSRTYVFDSTGGVKFRTRDHSYTQELVESKQISEEEAKNDPRRNQLTRALGIEPTCEPDVYLLEAERDESVLLCCDGLWNSLEIDEIGDAIRSMNPAKQVADSLAEQAERKDGSDNISLVFIRT